MLTRAFGFPLILLAFMLVSNASCDFPREAQSRLGVGIDPTGAPIIFAVTCPEETLVSVDIYDGASVVSGPTPVKELWKVRSRTDARGGQYRFPVGDPPPRDFELVIPLTVDLNSFPDLGVGDVLDGGAVAGATFGFTMGQLREGQVLTADDGLLSPEAFSEAASQSC